MVGRDSHGGWMWELEGAAYWILAVFAHSDCGILQVV